jgi:hypothetical protein
MSLANILLIPGLGGVNLLTKTEQINVSPWFGAVLATSVSVGGGAFRLDNFDGATGERLRQRVPAVGGTTYTAQVEVRGEGTDIGKQFRMTCQRGTSGTLAVGNADWTLTADWQRLVATVTLSSDNIDVDIRFFSITTPPASPFVRFPQLQLGSVATAYERVS